MTKIKLMPQLSSEFIHDFEIRINEQLQRLKAYEIVSIILTNREGATLLATITYKIKDIDEGSNKKRF